MSIIVGGNFLTNFHIETSVVYLLQHKITLKAKKKTTKKCHGKNFFEISVQGVMCIRILRIGGDEKI